MFDRPMNASEIAQEIGVSRQDVSQLLKRSLVTVYNNIRRLDPSAKPLEIAVSMIEHLNVDQTPEELKKFFRLLPNVIKEKILADGSCRLPNNPILVSIPVDEDSEDEDTEI